MNDIKSWSKEELLLLQNNSHKPLSEIHKDFIRVGFHRSKKSIERKKSRLINKPKTENVTIVTTENNRVEDIRVLKKKVYATTLVVPDAHTDPGQDLSRFIALGRYANDKKPNNIVFMGDFGNFDSLSKWDAGKEASHGKKYKEEIKTCRDALLLFIQQLDKEYKPNFYFIAGNHDEDRIERYIENHPLLRGHMDLKEDLRLEELGFKYIPYRRFLEIEGTLFTHAIMDATNKPVSGKNVMHTIASLTAKSVVVGHHHRFETLSIYRHGADDVQQVLLSGLFAEHLEDYVDGAANSFNRCVVMLTHTKYGRFESDQVGIERLKNNYL